MSTRAEAIRSTHAEHIINCGSLAETVIHVCNVRGFTVALHDPEINKPVHLRVRCGERREWLAARQEWLRLLKVPLNLPVTINERERDVIQRGDREPYEHTVRCPMGTKEIEAELVRRGIAGRVIRCHKDDEIVLVKVKATLADFKAAQYAWLPRLIAHHPRLEMPVVESDLFV